MGIFRAERIFNCVGCGYTMTMVVVVLVGHDKPEIAPEIKCPDCGEILETSSLTPREVQVVRDFTSGFTTREISAKLNISIKTVESHKKMAYRKLLINDLANLTKYALLKGLTSPEVRYREEER